MHKIKASLVFQTQFTEIQHQYPTRFSTNILLKTSQYTCKTNICWIMWTKTMEQFVGLENKTHRTQNFFKNVSESNSPLFRK